VTLTGVIIGEVAVFWHQFIGFVASLFRKFTDEAAVMEKGQGLRQVA